MVFRFKAHDVQVRATSWIEERLDEKRGGGMIFGRPGTGKSHAVRKAVEKRESFRVEVTPGPLLGQRFVADLARQIVMLAGQLDTEGRKLLEAFRSEGIEASLPIAAKAVNGHPFIVDGVEKLLPAASSLDDPAAILWQDEKQALLEWLRGRLPDSPTFLVGRKFPRGTTDDDLVFEHKAPLEWPIRLEETRDGFRNWSLLGKLAENNPAILTLARALIPLVSASEFNALLEQASEDEATVLDLLRRLGHAFQSSAPPSWQKVLALVGALGEIPRETIDGLLDRRMSIVPDAREPEPLEEARSALERLCERKLVEERSGMVSLLPALVDAGAIRALTANEREQFLPAVAHALLAPINDIRSLAPEHADRVLRAHAIFVELGEMSLAERTAALHVHGLVDLARRTSLNERHDEAWHQYDAILRMMQSGSWSTDDRIGRRLISYVRHYRARDGALAGKLDDAACLEEYRQALANWPENALWNQRFIEALIRLGRPIEAAQAVIEAYDGRVAEHPRRDELLRVRPAGTALRSGLPFLSLELIEPVLSVPEDLYPEVVDGCRALLRRWEKGIAVPELPFHLERGDADGRIVLHAPVEVTVRCTSDTSWVARLNGLAREERAAQPRGAIDALARHLADETRRLVSTPSSNLGDKDVRLKGRLLSIVDVLNSDIGLEHAAERWIVGRIVGNALVPVMRHLPPIELEQLPESSEGLYFALVPVYRDGIPSGPATELAPAGSGRDTGELLELLARMSEESA